LKHASLNVAFRHVVHVVHMMETPLDDISLQEYNGGAQSVMDDQIVDNDNDVDLVSRVHMCFETLDAVKKFYRDFAIRTGFGIRIRSSKKGKDNELKYVKLVCCREGNYVSTIRPEVKTLPSQTKQCQAGISVGKKDGKWHIRNVVMEHSHDISPIESRLISGNRKVNIHARQTVDINDEAGVRINKSYRSLVCEARGYENVSFIERDVRNYIAHKRRQLCKDGDGQALLRHFSHMREINNDFFFEIDMDEDNRISNVFWADSRSRAACEYFGNVVSFDTTYLTNKYDMPFAPFVGVNHHGQSILLGCGLVSAEDTSTFVWLFRCWLRCMSNKAPEGIITDQCKAMHNAIQIVFPNTNHRWCLWLIMKKVPEKLQGYTQYNVIKSQMKALVYDSSGVDQFEFGWNEFITNNGLVNNDWLCSLYEDRHLWVPCYLRNKFWAEMSTTQRSEGMNAFFDGFINSSTSLQQFVIQYDNALRQKAEKEFEADFASINTTVPCGSQSLIERQFQLHYTHAKFGEIQNEFRAKMNCFVMNVLKDGSIWNYNVKEDFLWNGKRANKFHDVLFDSITTTTKCSCLLFEFRGILCRHCFLVLGQEDIDYVPEQYVLRRWSRKC